MAKIYNLFISHSWSYADAYDRLVELLNARGYFPFKNYSIPKDDPIHNAHNQNDLYNAIYNQIYHANVVLIMAGVYATYSKWINFEIQIAKKEFLTPKPIIAVIPRGQTNISSIVRDNADEIIGWSTESIVSAIRKWG